MRAWAINYLDQDPGSGAWFNRGWHLHQLPRLTPLCRIRGHRPVVDGTDLPNSTGRWVVCDGCGVRPHPQGSLDPKLWRVGDRYNGPWAAYPLSPGQLRELKMGGYYPPGPWPRRPTGELGIQLVLGPLMGGVSAGLALGCAGNEQTLSAHLRTPLISLYVHTEQHGTWWQRRLNPTGYQNREIEVALDYGYLRWVVWADASGSVRDLPRWRHSSVAIDPRDWFLGPRQYSYVNASAPVQAVLSMPHGDRYPIVLQLQRSCYGRRRGRGKHDWIVKWEIPDGIATKPHGRGTMTGSGNWVSAESVDAGAWVMEALATIVLRLTNDRIRNGYRIQLPDGSVRE